MKKFISLVTAAAAAGMFSLNAAAEGENYITEYYSSSDRIIVFSSDDVSDNVTAMVAGVECAAENKGDIYHNAEKYETVFLIDSSKSMQSFSDEIADFLAECVDKKRDNEYFSFGLFSSGNAPEYVVTSESNQYTLEKAIDDLSYEFNSTYIYDNLVSTLDTLNTDDEPIYRRIVLITDGNENSARGITVDDVTAKLTEVPVPIFTVSLQLADKSNVEPLKNIGRIARFSHGEDMRIVNGGDAVKPVSVLSDSAQNVCEIHITPDNSVLDGSVKAVEVTDGATTVKGDVRLAMAATPVTQATQITEETTTTTAAVTEAPEPEKSGISTKTIMLTAAAAVAVICIIVVVVVVLRSKKKSVPPPEIPLNFADNEQTSIIYPGSGQTEILMGDSGRERYHTLILRDSADSVRTFEIQLSTDGAVIGRSSDMSSIVIDYDKSVSRKHCRIFLRNGEATIEDLGSGNKTFVNEKEVFAPTPIHNADEIRVGRTKLKVTLK